MRRALALIVLVSALAACTQTSRGSRPTLAGASSSPSPSASPSQSPSIPGCPHAPSPQRILPIGVELGGVAQGVDVWALVQMSHPFPVRANEPVKIVWKMTGESAIPNVVGVNANATMIASTQPLEIHGGSNWSRPGEEWGSEFAFPMPGCWDLHATLGPSSGDVWLAVAP